MQNKIIIPTGYMGSGSSAVTNLLSEIQGYDDNNAEFEYVMLHCPDGLFDLEDKLLIGNNALRSDEALHRFINCMFDLYSKNNYWVSGYKTKVSPHFMNFCDDFITELIDIELKNIYWYFQQNPVTHLMKAKNYLRRFVGKFSGGRIRINRPVQYSNMLLAFPTSDQFYTASKNFLDKIYMALGYDRHHLVMDQFLLPHNLFRIPNYFDDNIRIIVVDRDPRDMFILNKYIWAPKSVAVPYPLNAELFCEVYKKSRTSEKQIEDKRILRINFEDLVYMYNETIGYIYDFIGVDSDMHLKKMNLFNPYISINNTQLFYINKNSSEECEVIRENLKDYIYDFPKIKFSKSEGGRIF